MIINVLSSACIHFWWAHQINHSEDCSAFQSWTVFNIFHHMLWVMKYCRIKVLIAVWIENQHHKFFERFCLFQEVIRTGDIKLQHFYDLSPILAVLSSWSERRSNKVLPQNLMLGKKARIIRNSIFKAQYVYPLTYFLSMCLWKDSLSSPICFPQRTPHSMGCHNCSTAS